MDSTNYVEVYVKFGDSIDIPSTSFLNLYNDFPHKLKSQNGVACSEVHINPTAFTKYTTKEYFEDLIFERITDTPPITDCSGLKESVYRLNPVDTPTSLHTIRDLESTEVIAYHKNQLTLPSFPCTSKIYETILETRKTFKINNKLFLNFSTIEYASDNKSKSYCHIYLNYHHKSKCDLDTNLKSMQTCIELIKNS